MHALLIALCCMNVVASPIFKSEYLSALLGSIDESVVATDQNFIIEFWNKSAEQTFGYTAEEVLGRKGEAVLTFVFANNTREQVRSILVDKGCWKGQLQYKNIYGQVLLLDTSVTVVNDDEGCVKGYVAVYRDITAYAQAKTDLSTFLSIISSIDDSFIIVDRNLRIAYIDDKKSADLKTVYGISYSIGDNLIKVLPDYRRKQIGDCFNKALVGEKTSYQINVTSVSGKAIWLQASYFPIKDKNGYVTHACSVIRDITAQKENEILNEKLYKSRRDFEIFMENSPILSWITDSTGAIKYLNPSYLKTYDIDKEKIGKPLTEVFPKTIATAFREHDKLVLQINEALKTIEKSVTPDGKEHTYQVVKFPIVTDEEVYVGGWAIDISEEIELRQSLLNSVERLEKSEKSLKDALAKEHLLNELKSRFVSMASHEFRTPLSTILSSSYLLEKYTTSEQQTNRNRHIHRIKEAIHHIDSLLEDFLSMRKLEEGKTTVNKSVINLEELVFDIIEELNPIKKPGQTIEFIHQGEKVITSDAKLIKSMLINFISNAIKFSGENKSIFIGSKVTPEKVIISVKDQGIGMSEEDKEHLFESFYRSKNAQNIQGTGLGLHIAKRYADLLNGTIELESKLNEGTSVVCSLNNSK